MWVPKAGQTISNWHIIFPESPFTNQQVYFDKDSKPVTIDLPDEDGVDFKYLIAVDGGAPCDPHVIVVKGTGDQAQ